jgi:hypothetical protein
VLAEHDLVFVVPFKTWDAFAELKKQGAFVPKERVTSVLLDVRAHSRDIRELIANGEKVPRGLLTARVQKLVERNRAYRKAAPVENRDLARLRKLVGQGAPLDSLVHPLALDWYRALLGGKKPKWGDERLAERMPGGHKGARSAAGAKKHKR